MVFLSSGLKEAAMRLNAFHDIRGPGVRQRLRVRRFVLAGEIESEQAHAHAAQFHHHVLAVSEFFIDIMKQLDLK